MQTKSFESGYVNIRVLNSNNKVYATHFRYNMIYMILPVYVFV